MIKIDYYSADPFFLLAEIKKKKNFETTSPNDLYLAQMIFVI